MNLPGKTKAFINKNLCFYYKKLWSKCKTLWGAGHISAFWASNGSLKIKLSMILRPWLYTIVISKGCFSAIHWLNITITWLTLIFFVVLTSVNAYYFYWFYNSKLIVFCHFEIPTPSSLHHFCKFDQWVFSDDIYWGLLL